eukprot:CAMPEP_0168378382 /NCGR_PEP_ID=MMETSP0228-20121227/11309_1 /TAXON_ID=133427 /ORGANISM="Protoceratium reticulatum, Strain CCCM 535 (=CCMP 1889)" /LENGTH=311 /DNA_ID=CAMNT_0008391401 /DNA_START=64 /DNA_END=996 /DNA_ORIENTATION=+
MAPRASLVFAFLCGGALAGPVDQSSMLQSDVQVHDMSEGSLAVSEPPKGLALKTLMDLYSKTKQLPMGMIPANVSMEDMMKLGNDVLTAFTNRTFVAAVMEVIQDIANTSERLNKDTRDNLASLATTVANSSDPEVFDLVIGFFEQVNDTESWMMGQMASTLTKITNAFPFPQDLKMLPLGDGGLSAILPSHGVLGAGNFLKVLASDSSSVCHRLSTVVKNLTSARETMEKDTAPILDQLLPMIPTLEPMLAGLAPDAAPAIMRAINATATVIPGAIADLEETLVSTIELMNSVSAARLDCDLKSGSPGAP